MRRHLSRLAVPQHRFMSCTLVGTPQPAMWCSVWRPQRREATPRLQPASWCAGCPGSRRPRGMPHTGGCTASAVPSGCSGLPLSCRCLLGLPNSARRVSVQCSQLEHRVQKEPDLKRRRSLR
eukprot:1319180-Rhodomonas_salina.2